LPSLARTVALYPALILVGRSLLRELFRAGLLSLFDMAIPPQEITPTYFLLVFHCEAADQADQVGEEFESHNRGLSGSVPYYWAGSRMAGLSKYSAATFNSGSCAFVKNA